MYGYITNFDIPMDKKIILYQILHFLLNDGKFYNNLNTDDSDIPPNQDKTAIKNAALAINNPDENDNNKYNLRIKYMLDIIMHPELIGCAPRTIVEAYKTGGNKSGKYDYYLCKCNFKESLKKVVAKTAREAAKNLAKKVLKGNKKSIKFTLKRLIGKKEKYYNYEAHFDKNGKIVIKNQ
jgi:hypothetical protein